MRQHKLKKIALATAFALTGALVAPGAYAAGLGQLNVLSGLGQPLRAEIDLTSVSRQEASTLSAKMAGPDAYRQAGVEMSPALLGVRVAVNRRPGGAYYLSLTTVQPVNEPFVDALIELNWATGRLVREYTFLLDPSDIKSINPPVAVAPVPTPPVAVAPPVVTPTPPVAEAPKPEAPPAPPPSTPSAAPEAVKPAEQPRPVASGGTYEVKAGDTLAKVAAKNKQEGVSLEQMLVALYRANQDAFISGNINRLKSGVILNLPDKDAAASVAQDDARRLIVAQSSDWKAYQDKVAGGVAAAPAVKPEAPKQESRGRVTAKVEDKAQKPDADQLKLSKPGDAPKGDAKKGAAGANAGATAAAAAAAAKARAAEEELVAKDRQLRDANGRVAELEKNVRDLQRLVELKNQNLADLQKQAAAAKAEAKKAPEPPKAEPPKAPEVAKAPPKAEPPKVEPPKVEAPKAPEPVKAPEPAKAPEAAKAEPPKTDAPKSEPPKAGETPPADTKAAAAAGPGADQPKVDTPPPAPAVAEPPKAAEAPKAPPKKPAAPPPPPPPEPSLMDEFLGNPLYMGGGLLVLLALGAYAIIAVRRKRKVESFESSIITGGDLKANSVFGNTGGQSVDTGNSSFQSDFSQVGPGAIDADEVDPVAEADVYMAYGRDAQAEEILKEALVKDPNRQTVRMKLLEIYGQRRDPKSFEAAAQELHNATGGTGEQWNRAASLGQQIDPSNPLYGGTGEPRDNPTSTQPILAGAMAAAAAAPVMDFGTDKTVTLDAFNAAPAGRADDPMTKTVALDALQGQGAPADIDLDFDLGGDTSRQQGAAPDFVLGDGGPNTEPDPAGGVDFDLGFDSPAPAIPEPAPVAPAPAAMTDFSPSGTLIIEAPTLGMPSGAEKTIEMNPVGIPPAPVDDEPNNIDFDFDLGSPAAAEAPAAPAPAAAPAGNSMDFDLSSISLDLPGETAAADAGLNGSDDAATKLDLAKAYQEMGDKDGAKELLSEVLKEGSSAQQAEAQQLLASI